MQRFIVGGKTRDLQKLADVLPADAMTEAKRQIAKVIYDGAFKNDAAGDKLASAPGLKNAMQSIGPEKLKVFFSAKEIDELNRLTRITGYANADPAWGTVARGGNPGGVLFDTLARSTVPGAGRFAPLIGTLQQSRRAASALAAAVPQTTNLTPQEVRLVSGLLGSANVVTGGLLAP
ncbi:hypothetical protein [Roseateles sp.]|uniref:hypothetical protein n=1 Tax=Roseateles sp. TaxID=1971397 RepID=UPI003BAB3B86